MRTKNLVNHTNHENISLLIEYRPGVYRGLYIDVPSGEEVRPEQTCAMVENY
ncbi:MAG: hypothetical protein LUI02_04365 [Clostridiales bacterium]|nr:hypothetical protein [Clostridiales bacterium]